MGKKGKDYGALLIIMFIFPGGLTFILASVNYGVPAGILAGPVFWGIVGSFMVKN